MNRIIYEKTLTEIAEYMIENQSTIREAADHFGMSKSTLHIHLNKDLEKINYLLYEKVRHLLDFNLDARYKRGGNANRERLIKQNKGEKYLPAKNVALYKQRNEINNEKN